MDICFILVTMVDKNDSLMSLKHQLGIQDMLKNIKYSDMKYNCKK